MLELEEFNIMLQHIPGKNNGHADALSRRPDYNQGAMDNQDVIVLPNKLFIWALASQELEQDKDILKPCVEPHNVTRQRLVAWLDLSLLVFLVKSMVLFSLLGRLAISQFVVFS